MSLQVDKHIRRLDADLARFENELKEKLELGGYESTDGRAVKSEPPAEESWKREAYEHLHVTVSLPQKLRPGGWGRNAAPGGEDEKAQMRILPKRKRWKTGRSGQQVPARLLRFHFGWCSRVRPTAQSWATPSCPCSRRTFWTCRWTPTSPPTACVIRCRTGRWSVVITPM